MRAGVVRTITLARLRSYHFLAILQQAKSLRFLVYAAPGI